MTLFPQTPLGREQLTTVQMANLLKCNKKINIATMNTRTIREQKGQLELAENMKKANIMM
jgi:hypothetical protein